jgi:hypothetical protein
MRSYVFNVYSKYYSIKDLHNVNHKHWLSNDVIHEGFLLIKTFKPFELSLKDRILPGEI